MTHIISCILLLFSYTGIHSTCFEYLKGPNLQTLELTGKHPRDIILQCPPANVVPSRKNRDKAVTRSMK